MQQRVAAAIGKLGENMAVPRFVRYAGQGYVGQYIHLGGKIGVQVEFAGVTPAIAATRGVRDARQGNRDADRRGQPDVRVARAPCPADVLEKETAIYRAQMENSGKPANVIDKIVEGKLGSFYAQVVLPDQPSIRDPKMTVADVIAAADQGARRAGRRHALRPPQGRRSAPDGHRAAVDDL